MQLISGLTLVLMAITGRIAALPAADGQNGLEGIPVGSANGIYISSIKDDGSTHWEYYGHVQEASEPLTTRSNSSASEVVKRDSIQCNGFGINGNDVNNAQNRFSDMCGGGYYYGGRSIAVVYGSVVAFGCNYGNGQTCHAGDVSSFFSQITSKCGGGGAGWYAANGWKASYGRTSTGSGFC